MKILITGSSGHLGEALIRQLRSKKHEIVGIDQLPSSFTTATGSIADKDFVKQYMAGVQVVFHAATLHKPHVKTHSKQDFIDTNIKGTLNLLEAAHQEGVKSFIFTSTTSVFGDAMRPKDRSPAIWVTEDLFPIPKNIYGVTKLTAENICQLFHRNFNMPCIILRTSRFFAEADDDKIMRQSFSDANIKVNELLFRRADIQDVVEAHLLAMDKAPDIGFGTYIISATTPFRVNDLNHLQIDAPSLLNLKFPEYADLYQQKNWKMFPTIGRVYVNVKARKELEWHPNYDFQFALNCLKTNQDYRSPLARAIGAKGYHLERFEDGPYPV